jgi:hypothetical protein
MVERLCFAMQNSDIGILAEDRAANIVKTTRAFHSAIKHNPIFRSLQVAVHNARGMFRKRRAVAIENAELRLTALVEGGHIAEVFDKRSGLNPLWTPPWPSIEPSTFNSSTHREYGADIDAKLLAGIMGHNLCLDIFGAPTDEEAAAGLTPHGEASVASYDIDTAASGDALTMRADLPLAQIVVERRIALHERTVRICETITNLAGVDRPIGWTQHVTLGPPFLEKGVTRFEASATKSKTYESAFGAADYLRAGAEFNWPQAPRIRAGTSDLRCLAEISSSSAYTAHLMDSRDKHAFFVAFSPTHRLAFGYVWRRDDFPWLGIWEENHSRSSAPWNGKTLARGMEFGVSPFPESRRAMVDRRTLFDVPTYRWLPARGRLDVEYWVIVSGAQRTPEALEWPGGSA